LIVRMNEMGLAPQASPTTVTAICAGLCAWCRYC
jgi:hypothetical protein